ncbi:MAG: tetratricopeptide repeat protein, partial [Acidobacteriota bacterium]
AAAPAPPAPGLSGAPGPGTPGPGAANPGAQAAFEQVQELRTFVAQNPNNADAVRQLANLNFDISNWSRAVELYEQYLTLRPGDPNVLTDLGVALKSMNRFDEALEKLQAARTADPTHWQARYNEVIVLAFDLDRLDEAAARTDELVQIAPDNPTVQRLADEIALRQRGLPGS